MTKLSTSKAAEELRLKTKKGLEELLK